MLKERENVIVSATEPTGNNREKVWLKKSKNLYNAEQNINVSQTDTYHRVDLKANTTYTISFIKSRLSGETIASNIIYKFAAIRCFDETGTKISDISSSTVTLTSDSIEMQQTFITPNNLSYVGINFGNNNGDTNVNTTVSNIQIEKGTTATTYEPYVEPKMYCLNDNNVYEEFIQKENKIYSTEEQKVGTWIDGKPIYRKTIISTTFETNYYSVPSNIKQFITQYGYVQRKDFPTIYQFINSRVGTDMSIQFSESKIVEGIQIDWGSNWKNNYSNMFNRIIITIEYTKITD